MNYYPPLEFVLTWIEINIIRGVLNFLNIRIYHNVGEKTRQDVKNASTERHYYTLLYQY